MLSKKIKKLIVKLLLAFSIGFTIFIPTNNVKAETNTKPTIILDLAHRDYDDGTVIDNGASYNGIHERVVANDITLLVRDILVKNDINVVLTRKYDEAITIDGRIQKANSVEDYQSYISIHLNATESHGATGVESYSNNCWSLSNQICKDVSKILGTPYRGTVATPYYNIHINKSTIIELGFIDSSDIDAILNNKQTIAESIANNIIKQYQGENNTYLATSKVKEEVKEPKTKQVTERIQMMDGTYINVSKTVMVK